MDGAQRSKGMAASKSTDKDAGSTGYDGAKGNKQSIRHLAADDIIADHDDEEDRQDVVEDLKII